MFRSLPFLSVITLSACSDYEINRILAKEPAETESSCNYRLYVYALSPEACEQGYDWGWRCFPTAPFLIGSDIVVDDMETPVTDIVYRMFIKAMPQGNVGVDFTEFTIDVNDNGGTGWGTMLNEQTWRFTSWYTDASENNPVDSDHDVGRFQVNDRSWFSVDSNVTIPADEERWVWVNLDVTGLPVTSGDTITFTGSTHIHWYTDTVPRVTTMVNPLIENIASHTYTFPE